MNPTKKYWTDLLTLSSYVSESGLRLLKVMYMNYMECSFTKACKRLQDITMPILKYRMNGINLMTNWYIKLEKKKFFSKKKNNMFLMATYCRAITGLAHIPGF